MIYAPHNGIAHVAIASYHYGFTARYGNCTFVIFKRYVDNGEQGNKWRAIARKYIQRYLIWLINCSSKTKSETTLILANEKEKISNFTTLNQWSSMSWSFWCQLEILHEGYPKLWCSVHIQMDLFLDRRIIFITINKMGDQDYFTFF